MPVEDVVVEHHDVRLAGLLGPGGVGPALEHGDAAVRQPLLRLALPHELHARRAHDHRGERLVRLDRRQRLHGLAEALLVGDERAPARQGVAHARALEGVQLAAERKVLELGVVGVRERHGLRRALVLRHQLLDQLLRRLLHEHARMGLDELRELRRECRVGRHRHSPGGVAQEEAARPVHRVRLGQLPEVGRRGAVPDVEEREMRLAVLAHLERQLRRRRLPAVPQLACAHARQVVEPQAVELLHELARSPRRTGAACGPPPPRSHPRARAASRPGACARGSVRVRRERRRCRSRANDPSRSARPAPPGSGRGPGSARGAPRPPSPHAGARERASACGASRTSASAAP